MKSITVYLRSGHKIEFLATEFEIEHRDGQIVKWRYEGLETYKLLYFNPSDIVAVTGV